MTITGVPPYVNDTTAFDVTFTFDEDVTGFDVTDTNDVTATNAAIVKTGIDTATTYQATITPNGNGDITVTVNATDANGNDGPAADVSETAKYDAVAPTVQGRQLHGGRRRQPIHRDLHHPPPARAT